MITFTLPTRTRDNPTTTIYIPRTRAIVSRRCFRFRSQEVLLFRLCRQGMTPYSRPRRQITATALSMFQNSGPTGLMSQGKISPWLPETRRIITLPITTYFIPAGRSALMTARFILSASTKAMLSTRRGAPPVSGTATGPSSRQQAI